MELIVVPWAKGGAQRPSAWSVWNAFLVVQGREVFLAARRGTGPPALTAALHPGGVGYKCEGIWRGPG